MTTAVVAPSIETKARTPRKRKPKATGVVTAKLEPQCAKCAKLLDWRDVMYGREHMCKRCYRKEEKRRWNGVPVPATQLPRPTMAYGVAKIKAMTARPVKVKKPKPEPEPRKRRVTRAERRYKARQAAQNASAA